MAHPCTGCRHVERCRENLACECLAVYVQTGRISPYAPRQPNGEIFARIHNREPPRYSAIEKIIKRGQAAVRASRTRVWY